MSSLEEYSLHNSNESQGSASPSVDAGKEMVLGQKAKERKPKHLARSSNKHCCQHSRIVSLRLKKSRVAKSKQSQKYAELAKVLS